MAVCLAGPWLLGCHAVSVLCHGCALDRGSVLDRGASTVLCHGSVRGCHAVSVLCHGCVLGRGVLSALGLREYTVQRLRA
jgi:hypothetical protein